MIKVNILDIKGFFDTVNQCRGNVWVLTADGVKVNINRHEPMQRVLQREYQKNGRCLPLTLQFDDPKDYMAVVSYYAGDC